MSQTLYRDRLQYSTTKYNTKKFRYGVTSGDIDILKFIKIDQIFPQKEKQKKKTMYFKQIYSQYTFSYELKNNHYIFDRKLTPSPHTLN